MRYLVLALLCSLFFSGLVACEKDKDDYSSYEIVFVEGGFRHYGSLVNEWNDPTQHFQNIKLDDGRTILVITQLPRITTTPTGGPDGY